MRTRTVTVQIPDGLEEAVGWDTSGDSDVEEWLVRTLELACDDLVAEHQAWEAKQPVDFQARLGFGPHGRHEDGSITTDVIGGLAITWLLIAAIILAFTY